MKLADVAIWPFASFRTHALNGRSWSNNGHRAARARNPSVAFDPNSDLGNRQCNCFASSKNCGENPTPQ